MLQETDGESVKVSVPDFVLVTVRDDVPLSCVSDGEAVQLPCERITDIVPLLVALDDAEREGTSVSEDVGGSKEFEEEPVSDRTSVALGVKFPLTDNEVVGVHEALRDGVQR